MKTGKIFWGILVLIIGLLLLGVNLGLFDNIVWFRLFELWPVAIIIAGVLILFGDNVIGLIILLLLLAGSFYYIIYKDKIAERFPQLNLNVESVSQSTSKSSLPLNDVKKAKLNINVGAANFTLSEVEDDELYKLEKSNDMNILVKEEIADSEAKITISEKGRISFNQKNFKRDLSLMLNKLPEYELDIDSGASKLDLNLAELKVKKLKIDAGASNQNITFGNLVNEIETDIDAGVSSLEINLPKDYSLKIKTNSPLSSNNFDELNLDKNGDIYTSKDYESNNKRFMLNLDGGLLKINIKQN